MLTQLELFSVHLVTADRPQVSYWRIPINAEHCPNHEAFDEFVKMTRDIGESTHFVFNCQMGTPAYLLIDCKIRSHLTA